MGDRENTDQQQQQGGNQARSPLPTIPAPSAFDPDEPHAEAIRDQTTSDPQPPDPWFRNPDWHMVWITILLFAVGLYTACVFKKQFKEMQTQTGILNGQAQQAAKDSIDAAKKVEEQLRIAGKQALAAQDSVKAIQRQMRQDQRAWLRVVSDQKLPLLVPNKIVGALIHISNIGKTPAVDIVIDADFEIVPKMEEPRFEFKTPHVKESTGLMYRDDAHDTQVIMLARGNPILAPELLKQSDYDRLIHGSAYLVWFATVRYRDIFRVSHWSHFCSWYAPTPGSAYPSKKCTDYNSADNN